MERREREYVRSRAGIWMLTGTEKEGRVRTNRREQVKKNRGMQARVPGDDTSCLDASVFHCRGVDVT